MSIILTNYFHQYQAALRQEAAHVSLDRAISAFTRNYRDHTRAVSKQLDLIHRYRLPSQSVLAQRWTREARFFLLMAFEDVRGLDYLVQLHPSKRSFIEHEAATNYTRLLALEHSFTAAPSFSPPPRSA